MLLCDDYVVKLCDFGSSHDYIRTTLMSFAGTASWMAPEVIRNEPISDRADVFSFGVVSDLSIIVFCSEVRNCIERGHSATGLVGDAHASNPL